MRGSRLFSVIRAVLALAGAFVLAVTFTPTVKWLTQPLLCPWTNARTGTLILLTGPTIAFDGNPPSLAIGDSTYWRAMDAIYVWRRAQFQWLLLSGANAAETVKPLLIANGVPESAIVVENRAESTHDNAAFVSPLLRTLPQPYVLMTSDYHVYRASRCFARAGVKVETLPAPDALKRANSPLQRWETFWTVAQEYEKLAYYRLRGWI